MLLLQKPPGSIYRNSNSFITKHTSFNLSKALLVHLSTVPTINFCSIQFWFGQKKPLIHCIRCENTERGTRGRAYIRKAVGETLCKAKIISHLPQGTKGLFWPNERVSACWNRWVLIYFCHVIEVSKITVLVADCGGLLRYSGCFWLNKRILTLLLVIYNQILYDVI